MTEHGRLREEHYEVRQRRGGEFVQRRPEELRGLKLHVRLEKIVPSLAGVHDEVPMSPSHFYVGIRVEDGFRVVLGRRLPGGGRLVAHDIVDVDLSAHTPLAEHRLEGLAFVQPVHDHCSPTVDTRMRFRDVRLRGHRASRHVPRVRMQGTWRELLKKRRCRRCREGLARPRPAKAMRSPRTRA